MAVPSSGPTVELKATLDQLKKGLEEAVEKKASIETVTKMQTQLDALDIKLAQRLVGDLPGKSLADVLKENESVSRILHDRKGRAYIDLDANQVGAIMGRKSTITGVTTGTGSGGDPLNPVGVQTTGVLQIDRIPGITPEARQVLKIRDVLSAPADHDAGCRFRQSHKPDVDRFARTGSVDQTGEQSDLRVR